MKRSSPSSLSPYNLAKIVHHPEAMAGLRTAEVRAPIFVQLFPTNKCNAACRFCRYGHWKNGTQGPPPEEWKNNLLFDDHSSIPRNKMLETVRCLGKMGVKAVEITGGGEPLMYRYFEDLVEAIHQHGMDVALVTNGTLLTPSKVTALEDANFIWVRVSIDAGSPEEYASIRQVPPSQFERAWEAVDTLARRKRRSDAKVGVSYVVDRENWSGVYEGCVLAKKHGADNMRVSISFTPEQTARLGRPVLVSVCEDVATAKRDLEDDDFQISGPSIERWENLDRTAQDYPFCYRKEIGCVIGADSYIYTCCSLAYHPFGIMGSIVDKNFTEMWFDKDNVIRRQRHQPRLDCPVWCLYEQRNREALKFIVDPELERQVRELGAPPHVDFV